MTLPIDEVNKTITGKGLTADDRYLWNLWILF